MAAGNVYQRRASPNEQRTISREDLGHYYAVIVGAVYELKGEINLGAPKSFFPAISQCVKQELWLCVVAGDAHTDRSFFERVPTLDLKNHLSVRSPPARNTDDLGLIQEVLEADVDRPFIKGCPPWRVIVQPLTAKNQAFIAFSFSHTIGDGMGGPIFHRTFARGLNATADTGRPGEHQVVESCQKPLPEPFDAPERLPISWSFLLGPLLGEILPKYILSFLGLKASIAGNDEGTWTATRTFFDPDSFKTQVRVLEIEAPVVERALRAAREHDTKLTGVVHNLIGRALSKSLPDERITNFVSQTAINMRKSVGIPQTEMGEFASGCYITTKRSDSVGPLTPDEWAQAKEATQKLALSASQLKDHAIALLRYAPSIRQWMASKIGQARDSTFEMSNLGLIDVDHVTGPDVAIKKMVFTQPGHVTGPILALNSVSLKGGSMTFTLSWQTGALGIDGDEGEFIDEVRDNLKAEFDNFE